MVRRTRVHSRDIQPWLATPKALFAAARVQRLDFPMNLPTTSIDELGRRLHVGQVSEIPDVTVTLDAFDVSHDTFAYITGYTPNTFPTASGVSVTQMKNVDVIGAIRDATTLNIVNSIYVKRGVVSAIDATFGVRSESTVAYTIVSNSKKEFRQPVYYDNFTLLAASGVQALAHTATYLPRTSGYIIDAYRTGTDGTTSYIDEGTDFTVTAGGTMLNFTGSNVVAGDIIWVTYCSPITTATFQGLDDSAPAAIPGKYVPTVISASTIPRVQALTIRVAFAPESIFEMGGLGKPIGYEVGVPEITGDITVLKTDNDLLSLIQGQSISAVEADMEFAVTTLPLKVQLKDPRNLSKTVLTYYIPSVTFTTESDTSTVNQSMNEVFGYKSTTGEMYIASGAGPW